MHHAWEDISFEGAAYDARQWHFDECPFECRTLGSIRLAKHEYGFHFSTYVYYQILEIARYHPNKQHVNPPNNAANFINPYSIEL